MRIIVLGAFISVVVLLGAAALASSFDAGIKEWWRKWKYERSPYEVHASPELRGGTSVNIVRAGKRIQTYKYVPSGKTPEEREFEVNEAIAAAELEAQDWNRGVRRDRIPSWRSLGT